MTIKTDNENLVQIKKDLAKKYEHLATLAKSDAKRRQFSTKAARFLRQADNIARR